MKIIFQEQVKFHRYMDQYTFQYNMKVVIFGEMFENVGPQKHAWVY